MKAGDVIADRFELVEVAGSGGMGTVWRAHDRVEGRDVAVKLLTADTASRPRFGREARVLAGLEHPGHVRYVDHGETAEHPWLAMEWLEGEDLASRLEREELGPSEAVDLIRRIAEAVGEAHRRGIVHRDLKPSNVFLQDGRLERPRVLDFGVARLASSGATLTRTGAIVGTPAYMSPEQARGDDDVDARADVFSLGCLLFECLTGRLPFEGDHPVAVLAKVLLEEAPRLRDLRPDLADPLDELLASMLDKDRSRRPRDADSVAEALAAVPRSSQPGRPRRSHTAPALTGTELQLLTVVLAGGRDIGDARTIPLDDHPSHGDVIDDYTGDGSAHLETLADGSLVVTLTGAGQAMDRVARASRVALELHDRLRGLPVAVATGTGRVADKLPVGEVIDRAAALLSREEGGSGGVRVDEITAGLLSPRFDVAGDAAGLVLRGERDAPAPGRTLLGRTTPCVGRKRQLRILATLIDGAVEDSEAGAVLLVGPAGAGKSRLRHEALERAQKEGTRFQTWKARGDPMRAGSPFRLVAEAVRDASGMAEGEPIEARRQRLRALVSRAVEEEHRDGVAEFLGELTAVPFPDAGRPALRAARSDPAVMRDRMRAAWRELVAAEATRLPLVLVLEDLHWGDRPSIAFVDDLLRDLSDRPLVVIATARPEIDEAFPDAWRDRNVHRVPVAELPTKAAEELVREVLGERATDQVVHRIVERCQGNALFLEELIRAEAEGRSDVPDTVVAIVQSRLELLEPEARRVLRAGSISGASFWRGCLAELLGGEAGAPALDGWLETLVERELLVRRPESRFPGETEYAFRHGLVGEAAHRMLTDADRRLGHRITAEWLERMGEVDATSLAEHFEKGGAADRAVPHWLTAGREALEGNELEDAHQLAARGIQGGADGEVRGALRHIQAVSLGWRGEYEQAARLGLEAISLSTPGTEQWCRSVQESSGNLQHTGRLDELRELAETLLGMSARGGHEWVALAQAYVAVMTLFVGLGDLSDQLADKARDRLRSSESHEGRGWLAGLRLFQAVRAGDTGTYLAAGEEAAREFAAAGDHRRALTQWVNFGFALGEAGDPDRAVEVLRWAEDECEKLGIKVVGSTARCNLGVNLVRCGAMTEGRAVLESACQRLHDEGHPRMEASARTYLSRALADSSELEGAEREARRAAGLAAEAAPPLRPYALAAEASARVARGDDEGALPLAREAMEALERGDAEEGHAFICATYAELCHRMGDGPRAREIVASQLDLIEEQASTLRDPELARTFREVHADHVRIAQLAEQWGVSAGGQGGSSSRSSDR